MLLTRLGGRSRLTRQERAWNVIESVIAAQNYVDYPWIYTAHTLTENDPQLLNDWCWIIKLHYQLVPRELTTAELEKITHYWLGSKGVERFM